MATERPLILEPNHSGLHIAAETLRRGGLVAFPTETVYGLGGDAISDHAVATIFEAKGRPSFNPLIIHFANPQAAWAHVIANPVAKKLAEAFWPGPLTMVLPRHEGSAISLLASAGLDTLAIRVPAHETAHELLVKADRPIAAPSANRSGGISPTLASHVSVSLGQRVDAIIDGGPCHIGIESTVVAFTNDGTNDRAVLLRPGGITRADLEAVIGPMESALGKNEPTAPRSPGMLERHYAPDTPVRLNAKSACAGEVLLGFGPGALSGASENSLNLSENGDVREAAANLFAMLRQLDCPDTCCIAVMPIPETGLGIAINDRLRRAATPESP